MKQLQMGAFVEKSYYSKTLMMLYELQNDAVKDQLTVQKMIELVVDAQSNRKDNFTFYMQRAVRDLPSDTPVHEVMAYIEKLKQQN